MTIVDKISKNQLTKIFVRHQQFNEEILCGLKVKVAQRCLTVTPWTIAFQAPLSMEFSRPEDWSK